MTTWRESSVPCSSVGAAVCVVALLGVLLGAVRAAAQASEPLPDLNAIIDQSDKPVEVIRNKTVDPADVAEGCAGGLTGRTLLSFTLATENVGTADLVLGNPGCPRCDTDPPLPCDNPLYECSVASGHFHPHFARFARYEVLAEPNAPAVLLGRKQGFCIEDTVCAPEKKRYNCRNQGITAGCMDSYPALLGCQYVDVTDLPGGRYLLRASVNFDHLLPESNYDNNTAEVPFEICDETRKGIVRMAYRGPSRGKWVAAGQVVYDRPPLVSTNPLRDGALVRVGADGAAAIEVAIPGGKPGTGCRARDGWRKLRRKGAWGYTNTSGFLDAACTIPASGLRSLRIVRTQEAFSYTAKGRMASTLAQATGRTTVTVVMGQVTGPCGAHTSPCAVHGHGSDSITCSGVDPCVLDPSQPGCDTGGGGGTVPGPRTFSVAEGAEPGGSHFFTSAINGGDVTNDGFNGAINIFAGPPGPDGVAPLRVASDSVFGFTVLGANYVCVQVQAADSEGKIDCDGGTAVDVALSGDSHGEGVDDPPLLSTGLGAAGPAGAAYLEAHVRVVNCARDQFGLEPACIGAFSSADDCQDPTKVDFTTAAVQGVTAFTTGSATAELLNPRPGSLGGALPQTGTGRPFDCANWSEDGPGILVAPQIGYANPIAGDVTNIIQIDD